jgi:hypothetical protein
MAVRADFLIAGVEKPLFCRMGAGSNVIGTAGHQPRLHQRRRIEMKYLLMVYGNEQAMMGLSKEAMEEALAAYGAYREAVTKAGIYLGSNRLRPTKSASTVRVSGGKTQVLDGPYTETKEQLGGYYMIDVPDLDAALSWAARCPGASHGSVEVRPIWEM